MRGGGYFSNSYCKGEDTSRNLGIGGGWHLSLWRESGGPGGGLKGRRVVGKKLEKVPAHHPRPQTERVKELSLFSAHK